MNEELKNILSRVDHTLLAQGATWNEIKAICDDGIKYGCASVCIPASYVKQAAAYVDGKIAVCTVIGFPNGYMPTAAKACVAWAWRGGGKSSPGSTRVLGKPWPPVLPGRGGSGRSGGIALLSRATPGA